MAYFRQSSRVTGAKRITVKRKQARLTPKGLVKKKKHRPRNTRRV